MNISSPIDVMTTELVNKKLFFLDFMTYLDFVAKIHIIVYFTVSLVGFFATVFSGTHERKWRRQVAAVLYQLVLRLFMDVYFSNHTFTCSMLYSSVMIAVWSFMATNRTLS